MTHTPHTDAEWFDFWCTRALKWAQAYHRDSQVPAYATLAPQALMNSKRCAANAMKYL